MIAECGSILKREFPLKADEPHEHGKIRYMLSEINRIQTAITINTAV
jgi:hypothetical protein